MRLNSPFTRFIVCALMLGWIGPGRAALTADRLRPLEQQLLRPAQAARLLDSLALALTSHPGYYLAHEIFLNQCLLAGRPLLADSVFRQIGNHPEGGGFARFMLGRLALIREDTTAALRHFAQALHWGELPLRWMLEISEVLHRKFGTAWRKKLLAMVPPDRRKGAAFQAQLRYISTHDPDALRLAPAVAKQPWAWEWDWHRAYSLFQAGRFSEARELAQARLRAALDQPVVRAHFHFLLGRSLLSKDVASAEVHLDSALVLSVQHHLYHLLQEAAGWKGIVNLRYRFDYPEAVFFYRLARQLALKIGAETHYFAWSGHLGEALFQQDEYSRALEVYLQAEKRARRKHNLPELIHFHWKKGDLFNYLRLEDLAEAEFTKARQLDEKIHHNRYRYFYQRGLADLAFRRGDYEKARALFQALLSRSHSLLFKAYGNIRLGLIFRAERQFKESEKALRRAMQAADSARFAQYQCWSRTHLGDLYQQQKAYRKAIDMYRRAWRWRDEVKEFTLPISLLTSWAQAELFLGQIDSARHHLKQAVALIEKAGTTVGSETLQGEFFSLVGTAYNLLAASYLASAPPVQSSPVDSALFYLEASRARRLKKMLAQPARLTSPAGPLAHLEAQLEQAQATLRGAICAGALPDSIQLYYSRVKTIQYQYLLEKMRLLQTTATPKARQQSASLKALRIPQDWTVLYYCLSQWRSYCVVLAANALSVVELPVVGDSLRRVVERLRHLLRDDQPAAASNDRLGFEAHRLYNWLMAPVEKSQLLSNKVLVVPDPEIMGLPFELLLRKAPIREPEDWAEASLQSDYAFAYAPALALPIRPGSRGRRRSKQWLILANPFVCSARSLAPDQKMSPPFQETFFQPLIGSEKEGQAITELHPASTFYRRAEARESLLDGNSLPWQVIHIASHGFADPWFDEFSGLVLADDTSHQADGYFMGYEILRQNFSAARLVSLSACETGTGRIQTGEGLLGLPRLFLGAGAGAVLMSLWKVEDEFSARLMPRFYQQLEASPQEPALALARARRRFLAQRQRSPDFTRYLHPAYWAAFQLYVNPARQFAPASPFTHPTWQWLLALTLLAALAIALYRCFH
ncbi:MAG: CHAT domain-containing protein [Calditrichaeota bacterium]|nr:MAG: CHAT domain-containing protein [Calditrichota bacterium]